MPVSIAIGGDPLYTWCATAPLPYGVNELLMYGLITKKPAELVKSLTTPLYIPKDVDYVIEGWVDPTALKVEGPFGDHTGYYTLEEPYPVLEVSAITMKRDRTFLATVVGKPPLEDKYMGWATGKIFFPLLKTTTPDLIDYHMPENAGFHNLILAKMQPLYKGHAKQFMHAFWEQIRQMRGFYPLGGMQALADAVAASITRRGGKLFLKHGIKKIIVDKNRAAGIEDDTGTPHYADIIVSNAPLPYTVENLLAEAPGMEHLRNRIRRRRIFPAAFLVFTGINADYNFHEYNYLTSAPSYQSYKSLSLKPEEVPFAFFLPSDYEEGKIRPAVLMAPLPYEYGNCWASGPGRMRNEEYRTFKNSIADILLKRLGRHLGAGFQDAVKFAVAATPLTFERYTNNASGSFMGFSIQQGEYGNFFAQESPVKNLYCAGQWVFPGFGVSGTAAGGYYCARSILRNQGISLDKILQESAGT